MRSSVTFMDDAQFWQLIEQSRSGSGEQAARLEAALSNLSANQIVEFNKAFDRAMAGLYRWDLWGAAYVIQGGASDDAFDYFCAWIISQGESSYRSAIQDARAYGMSIELSDEEFDGESLMYAAEKAYEKVVGKELPSIHSVRPKDPMGEPWDEDHVEARFPELATKWNAFHESGGAVEAGGLAALLKRLFKRR